MISLMIVYDPRDNSEKSFNHSLNAALIAAYYLEEFSRISGLELDIDFYRDVIIQANYCDELVVLQN